MPDLFRIPTRCDCLGLDLSHPVDRMPEGYWPYLFNTRVLQEGRIEARPGYALIDAVGGQGLLHSIRRLNKTGGGDIDVVGDGTELWAGAEGSIGALDTGYSGDPLSLLTFRPDQSSEAWMYVYDANKSIKVRGDLTTREIGLPPPQAVTNAEYGQPAEVTLNDGQSATGWTNSGAAGVTNLRDRTGGTSPTIVSILYNTGTTGWACINPNNTAATYPGDRMRILLNSGGGNQETVVVREIHNAITTTTIQGIQYDSGTTGLCSMVLIGSPSGLARNSLISIGGEVIRVLAVVLSPDGSTYSLRCSTTGTRAAGNSVTGLLSWYVYTTQAHAAAETISAHTVYTTVTSFSKTNTIAAVALLGNIDASKANGRPISLADDYMHISFWATNAPGLVTLKLYLDIDANTTALGNAFTNNYLVMTLTPAQIYGAGAVPASGAWIEITQPLASFVHAGTDPSRTLSGIKALKIEVTLSSSSDFAFDWWYLFGTFGPTILPNSPTGYLYQSRDRDSTTGAASVPSPQTRYELFPLREEIKITPQATSLADVDSLDIYRQGGTLTQFTYVGTVANNNGSPNTFSDDQPDSNVAASPVADYTLLQPWPVLDLTWLGTVNVIGTTVIWQSGTTFNTKLVSGTVILIGGVAYQTYGQPTSATRLEITADAGVQTGVAFTVASPTLAAQPIPYAFGPLEGPLVPVAFALGDPKNPGTLYYSNAGNLDAASDANTLEICPPGEPLISGQVWNGLVICGSRDNLYLVRYSYLQATNYQFMRLPSASGIWSRWASCRGPDGVYFLGRDGIYRANESGADIVGRMPDGKDPLYPLFPHDGQTAAGANNILPVDMTQLSDLRLSCCDWDIYFDYLDTNGTPVTLRYEIPKKRWFPHSYGDPIRFHYLVEPATNNPNTQQILLLGRYSGNIYLSGGNTDNAVVIQSLAQSASYDSGDERAQKLYEDWMVDADGTGIIQTAVFYDNDITNSAAFSLGVTTARQQFLTNIASLSNLALHRNISVKFSWTGGPAGPRIYAFEPSGYAQPMLMNRITTQYLNLDFPDWKHFRRFYPGLISNTSTIFTIKCQDGRAFPITIPSTGGQLKIIPLMVPQNCKDLAFAFQLDGQGQPFALFPDAFTLETKGWTQPSYIELAVFKT